MKIYAIILAGGIGKRMNSHTPKQFLEISGKPIILYSLEEFEKNKNINGIIIVINKDLKENLENILKKFKISKLKKIVLGGETRQESAFNGLQALKDVNPDYVLIHDSARPFLSQDLINRIIDSLKNSIAVNPVIPIKSTIIKSDNEIIKEFLGKKDLYEGQSPQGFHYNEILNAHLIAKKNNIINASDDCILIHRLSKDIRIVEGDNNLIKITTPEDIEIAKKIWGKMKNGNN
ncbi:MAG: 2-C-methyl-D-erythritol 4-phosphate cytidylyltransferase [Candidatus Pacearchaeota archaeon]